MAGERVSQQMFLMHGVFKRLKIKNILFFARPFNMRTENKYCMPQFFQLRHKRINGRYNTINLRGISIRKHANTHIFKTPYFSTLKVINIKKIATNPNKIKIFSYPTKSASQPAITGGNVNAALATKFCTEKTRP